MLDSSEFLFLVETGFLLTKVGSMLDVFVLDAAHGTARRCSAQMLGVDLRADGTGSSPRMDCKILRQPWPTAANRLAAAQERSGPRNRF